MEASPINPSDQGLLFGGADMSTAKASGTADSPVVTASVPPAAMKAMAGRLDQSLPVGNEGAGVVVQAGSSPAAQALLGKTVAILGGAMYAQYRCIKAVQCLVLPPGTTPAEGASCFVNPAHRARHGRDHARRGPQGARAHRGRLEPRADARQDLRQGQGRPGEHRAQARAGRTCCKTLGATHVCDSSAPTFMDDLTEALVATGATVAFDAIGGGKLAGQILTAMEIAREPDREGVQPLRLDHAQAGLHLRRASTAARPSSTAPSAWRGASAAGC